MTETRKWKTEKKYIYEGKRKAEKWKEEMKEEEKWRAGDEKMSEGDVESLLTCQKAQKVTRSKKGETGTQKINI